MGELSAGRQALEAAVVALGTQRTLDTLQDTSRRPRQPRVAVPGHIAQLQPDNLLDLDQFKFRECIHSARRGAAARPCGMTAEHLKPMLDSGDVFRRERHCRGRRLSEGGRAHHCQALQQAGRGSHGSIPVRPFHQGWLRVRDAPFPGCHRHQ